MKKITIKHTMDAKPRKLTLDEAFLEALQLSEGRTCEIEKQEDELYEYLYRYPKFISNITNEYKVKVLKAWDYEIIEE